jgi:hypothetical protein
MSVVRPRGPHHAHHLFAVSFCVTDPLAALSCSDSRAGQSWGKSAPGTHSAKICRAGTVPPI